MGGSSNDDNVNWEDITSRYGSHVNKSWLESHGITLAGSYTDRGWENFVNSLGAKIAPIEEQEMVELDEQWAIDKRKTMKKGKSSLLSGGTTGLGLEEPTSNSLLKG